MKETKGYLRFLVPETNIQTSIKGECAQLKWLLFGYPIPEIRFSFNNQELSMTDRYAYTCNKDGNLILSIAKMGDRDQGVYEAIASNKYGEARQRLILQLAVRPRLIQLPEETTVLQRSQARFEARVAGFPTPQVTWFKDWVPLVHSEKVRVLWREPETAVLLVNGCTSRDTGLYSVSVRNKAGVTNASVMLHVEHDEFNFNYQSYSTLRSVRPRNKAFEDFYDIGDEIGRGTQGIVYHVVERSNGRSFAAKCMNGKGDHRQAMNSELWIMNQLSDRCIVRLYDAYESSRQLILVEELCSGGDVLTTFCQQSVINESDVANVARQVLWALLHMHTKHVAHLGITPGDILFSRPGGEEVKICDFSYSRHVNPERPERLDYGMPEFVAPEVVNGETVGLPADIWSVGVVTYLLLTGTAPFKGKTDKETLTKIRTGDMHYDTEAFAVISDQAKDFIAKMLVFSPASRLDVKQALKHPWLKFADRAPSTLAELPTEKLVAYQREYRNWLNTSVCQTWFRRRPLSSAVEHPAGHLYPREVEYTPPPSPEPTRHRKWQVPVTAEGLDAEGSGGEPALVMESLDPNLGWLGTESHYQQGPDTFLVQLRDTGLPSRLREYVKVACQRSPYLATKTLPASTEQYTSEKKDGQTAASISNPWWKLPLLHERRRFTDIMDEEMDAGRRSRIDKYSASAAFGDAPAQYVARRLRYDVPSGQPTLSNEAAAIEIQRQRQMPYFREKPTDEAIVSGGHCLITCYAVGDPAPVVQWFRNDVPISESKRVRLYQTREGRSVIEILHTIEFDQGVYKAVARNPTGQSVVHWRLYMGDAPGAIDMPEVVEYSDTQALIRWNVPYIVDNAPIIAYSLQMKQLIEHEWTTVADNINHEFMRVEHLHPECNYQFRLRARNKFGFGPFSVPTPTCRTRKQGWTRKVLLGHTEQYLQSVTELQAGSDPVNDLSDPAWLRPLDYEVEDFPISLTDQSPKHKFKFLEEIFRGEMSVVTLCVDLMCNQLNVAKVVDCSDANSSNVYEEFEVLRSLRHQRVAALFDAYRIDTRLVLIMEPLEGTNILRYFQRQHEYSEQLVAMATSQILDGLQYLHWRGLVHLNLQPDNVVAASARYFGFKLVDMAQSRRVSRLGRMVPCTSVTPYTAPELLVDEPVFPSTDIWSLGVLLYVLLSGLSPFEHHSEHVMRQNVLYVRVKMQHLFQEATPEVSRFLTLIFRRGPSKRPTCEECMEHRWLSDNEFMQKRRQRAVFFGNRLKEYSEHYHELKRKQQMHSTDLLAGFGLNA